MDRERRGRVVLERIESAALEGNAPGDPATRTVPVYLPPAYDEQPARRFPVCYVLSGFTGRGTMLLNDQAWTLPLDRRMDLLIERGCGEMILVLPDCFTRYGGSQYLDSSATGRYEEHLIHELLPWIDARYRTDPVRERRAIMGKSSGGYGALTQAMRHPEAFAAVASHSGDMYFDYCYRGDVPKLCSGLQRAGGLEPWLGAFEAALQKKQEDFTVLNMVAMSACYSPNPVASPYGFDVPCDLETGAFREDVWARWLALDPLHVLESRGEALRAMRLVYLDCGTRDEWHLHHGARLFARRLRELGIEHEHQEFDDGHMNVGYRQDVSLPKIAAALGA